MALIRWEPAREMSSLQSEMNRLFSTFFDGPSAVDAPAGTGLRRWVPAMDLVETDGSYVLKADLPGLAKDDVKVELNDNVLTVSGERKAEHEDRGKGYHRVERAYGSFSRTLTLPEGVDPEAIEASFDKGVLEVRVPKPAEKTPHRVEIAVGGTPIESSAAERNGAGDADAAA